MSHVLNHGSREHVEVRILEVPRLRVGHSAHVSAGGYVAASPFIDDPASPHSDAEAPWSERDAYSVGWFTSPQLAALDATEPNYRRVLLPTGVAPVVGAQVYASVHGLIGERGRPLPLCSQDDLLRWLQKRLPCLRTTANSLSWPYADARLRAEVRRELAELGYVTSSGLENS